MIAITVNEIKRNAIRREKHWKDKKQDSSGSLSSGSYLSRDCDYKHKGRKKKSHWKNDPIKLCARLTVKLLTTVYKSKIIKFKLDEVSLQCRIYFLAFVESLEMIFSHYKETSEVLLDYPKTREDIIQRTFKKSIRNILHANIDVNIRSLLAEFPGYGIKCIERTAITLCQHYFY